MDPAFESFVRALPKAELHLHLEGSMHPEFAVELAHAYGVALPAFRFQSFDAFIRLYVTLSSCLQHPDDIRNLVVDLGRRLDQQNVRYAEVTFTPMTHVARGFAPDRLMRGLAEGRDEVHTRFGVLLRWVFDVVRSFPDQAEPTLAFAVAMREHDPESVVGLGVGGPEAGTFDMSTIARTFAKGRALGFHSVPHAGEWAGPQSVWTAVRELGADRIGHGIRSLEDPALIEHLRVHGIALEVCPTSNVVLGAVPNLAAHPIVQLLEVGVPIVLGSDDPGLFGTDLVQEFVRGSEAFGWDPARVRALARASIDHSFMPETLADDLRRAQDEVPDP